MRPVGNRGAFLFDMKSESIIRDGLRKADNIVIVFIIILGAVLPFFAWWGFHRQDFERPAKTERPTPKPLMDLPIPLPGRFEGWGGQFLIIFAAVLSWLTIFLLYHFGDERSMVGFGVLWGPSTLALTYFALGGGIPLKLRQKGWRPLTIIPVIFWFSMLAMMIVVFYYP